MASVTKKVDLKLFFNLSNRTFYAQVGGTLYPVTDRIAATIQEREDLEIRHAADMKAMQLTSLEDDKIQGV